MKKLVVSVFTLLFVGLLAACSLDVNQAQAQGGSYLLIEINPKIEFTLDEEEKVVSVDLLNEDAEIVAGDIDFIGLDADVAVELYLTSALEAGYLDVTKEDNAIFITLFNDDEEREEGLNQHIRERVQAFMHREQIQGGVFGGHVNREDIQAIAEEYEVRFNQARAAFSVSEADENISLEEALEMDFQELMAVLRENHQRHMQAFGQAMRENARAMREAMIAAHRDRVRDDCDDCENNPEE